MSNTVPLAIVIRRATQVDIDVANCSSGDLDEIRSGMLRLVIGSDGRAAKECQMSMLSGQIVPYMDSDRTIID